MKKIQKTLLLIMFSFLLINYTLLSQGGSNYSIFGIGDINTSAGSAYDGMGGTSIAMPNDNAINQRNPAMWSMNKTTRIQTGYLFNQNVINSQTDNLAQNNGKVNGLQIMFSIDTALGLSAAIGFYPYSSINYYIYSKFSRTVLDETIIGSNQYEGTGGLSMGFIGVSTKVIDDLYFGAEFFSKFGRISSQAYTIFDNYTFNYTYNYLNDNITSYGGKFGLYYTGFNPFSIGAFYETGSALSDRGDITYNSEFSTDVTEYYDYLVKLPPSFGVGVSYIKERFIAGIDFLTQDFSDFDFNSSIEGVKFKRSSQLSFGLSFVGKKTINANLAERISYNLGGGFKQLYYSVNGTNINEYYGSFGLEIPLVNKAKIDAAVIVGIRGTTDNGLLRETFGRLSINLSIGDTWFKPYKHND